MQVVDPPADGGGDEAGGAAVALLHQGGVLSHHDEETQGRANREKVFHLEVIGTVTLWSVVDQEREGGGVPGISPILRPKILIFSISSLWGPRRHQQQS